MQPSENIISKVEQFGKLTAIEFAEWIEMKKFWKSTDTRFPATVGRWLVHYNGDVPYEETYDTPQLYEKFQQSKTQHASPK